MHREGANRYTLLATQGTEELGISPEPHLPRPPANDDDDDDGVADPPDAWLTREAARAAAAGLPTIDFVGRAIRVRRICLPRFGDDSWGLV